MAATGTTLPGSGAAPIVIYIAGSGRSGSTLVERTLGQAPGFVNVGELIDLYRRVAAHNELCGCGLAFGECPFWTSVGHRAFGGWRTTNIERVLRLQRTVVRQRRMPLLLTPIVPRSIDLALQEYAQEYTCLYRAIAQESGASRIVDASKWPAQALALTLGGIDVRIIHLIRDVRGVAHSASKHLTRPHAPGDCEPMSRTVPVSTGARWAFCQLEVELLRCRRIPISRLRYEDFVTNPRRSLGDALTAIGLSPEASWFDHVDGDHITLARSHGLSGNPSRFTEGPTALVRDETWRQDMARPSRAGAMALCLPQLALYRVLSHRSVAPARSSAGDVIGTIDPTAKQVEHWPLVSVVLPTRQRPELVRESIAAVIDQTYPGAIECIVVHDQEDPDRSLETLSTDGRSIVVTTNRRSPGLAGARNTGLSLVHGDFVASCDDDDTWHPTKLTAQIRRLLEEPDLLVVGSGIRLRLPAGRVVDWPGRSNRVNQSRLVRNRVKELHSSTLVMHRDAFAKAGSYDETLPHGYAEDYDWVLRAARVGRIGVVREPLADIRKDVPSWFRERAENTASALECLLEKHPEIVCSRRGHARVLGQIAFAWSSLGRRSAAVRLALTALMRWPAAPHAYLALLHATTGIEPKLMLRVARIFRRGLS